MPNKTANYNLVKPLGSEHYDINVHNGNMDIIDEELRKITESNNKRIDEETKKVTESTNKRIDEEVKKNNELIKNIKVPVTSVNSKVGDLILSANDIKNSEGKTIETKLTELFQSANSSLAQVNNGKTLIASAVGSVNAIDTFETMATHITVPKSNLINHIGSSSDYPLDSTSSLTIIDGGLQVRLYELATALTKKGVTASRDENLGSLIQKVGSIQTGYKTTMGTATITVPADYSGGGIYSASVLYMPITVNNLDFKPKVVFYYVDGSWKPNIINVDNNSRDTSGPGMSNVAWMGQVYDSNDSVASNYMDISRKNGFSAHFSDFFIEGRASHATFTNTGFSMDVEFSNSRPFRGGRALVNWLAIG